MIAVATVSKLPGEKVECLLLRRNGCLTVVFGSNFSNFRINNLPMKFAILSSFLVFSSLFTNAQGNAVTQPGQVILSPLETVNVKESNEFWKAEIDGERKLTVINAHSIAVMNASFPKEKNITKNISFKLSNGDDKGRTVNATVTGIAEHQGKKLYQAELEIGINLSDRWEYRKVNCILADLSEAEHKLIIGKDWLGDDIIVK